MLMNLLLVDLVLLLFVFLTHSINKRSRKKHRASIEENLVLRKIQPAPKVGNITRISARKAAKAVSKKPRPLIVEKIAPNQWKVVEKPKITILKSKVSVKPKSK